MADEDKGLEKEIKEMDDIMTGIPADTSAPVIESVAGTVAVSEAIQNEPAISAAITSAETAAASVASVAAETAAVSAAVTSAETAVISTVGIPAETAATSVVSVVAGAPPPDWEVQMRMAREQNEKLLKQLNDLAAGTQAPPPPKVDADGKPIPEVPAPTADTAFVADEKTYDEILKDATSFNKLLNEVKRRAVEETLLSVPRLAVSLVNQQMTMRLAAEEFYKVNTDLAQHRSYIAFVTNETAAKHPEYDLKTLLEETAKEARSRLGIQAGSAGVITPNAPNVPQPPGSPAFVDASHARPGPNPVALTTGEAAEIGEMLKTL